MLVSGEWQTSKTQELENHLHGYHLITVNHFQAAVWREIFI